MLFVVIIISLICLYFFFSTSDSAKTEEINRLASLQAKSIIDQKEAELQGKFKKTEYDLINKYNNKIAQKLNEMESFKHNIEIQYKKESLDSIEAHKKEINTYYNNLIADHMNQYNDAKLRLEDEKKVLERILLMLCINLKMKLIIYKFKQGRKFLNLKVQYFKQEQSMLNTLNLLQSKN